MAKKDQYYQGFVSIAQTSCDIARLLDDAIKQYDLKMMSKTTAKLQILSENISKQQQELFNLLSHDFLPPLDQEDIANIIRSLINMSRQMCHFGMQVEAYRLPLLRQDIYKGVNEIHQQNLLVLQAMNEWKQKKKPCVMNGYVVSMQENQTIADRWYQEAMKNLFTQVRQPLDIIIYSRMYDQMKDLFLVCEDIRCLIINIMIKYT